MWYLLFRSVIYMVGDCWLMNKVVPQSVNLKYLTWPNIISQLQRPISCYRGEALKTQSPYRVIAAYEVWTAHLSVTYRTFFELRHPAQHQNQFNQLVPKVKTLHREMQMLSYKVTWQWNPSPGAIKPLGPSSMCYQSNHPCCEQRIPTARITSMMIAWTMEVMLISWKRMPILMLWCTPVSSSRPVE